MSEPQFQRYSGRRRYWCKNNFQRYLEAGLAKRVGKRRYWSTLASPPQSHETDTDKLRQEIVTSYTVRR
ncbi:MAG: hypothetical protein JSW71_06685 [Gemmatimonadota bacterium]|nr:MAG: hypothetical protein JSW71_06685 [Gemmatimonadota bacterium]